MSSKILALSVAVQLLAVPVLAGPARAADDPGKQGNADQGKALFTKTCGICHTAEEGKNKIGPSLFGVVGREAAKVPNYTYSDAMKNSKKTWTPQELDTYIADPRQVVPGTKMIFAGLKKENERDDVIAYLETLK
jgi:cytochrome c